MILENIKNGCSISAEYFAQLQQEILATHLVVQTPKNGMVTVKIRRIYNEQGERVNCRDVFFYVHCYQEAGIKKAG